MKVAAVLFINLVFFGALGNFYAQNSAENGNEVLNEFWDYRDDLEEKFPYYCSGFDADGRPVWVIEFGKWDIRSIVSGYAHVNKNEFAAYYDEMMCRIQKSIKIRGTEDKPVREWGFVADMKGFDNKQLTSPETIAYTLLLCKKWEKGARNMDYGFIINMDGIAEFFLRLLKPALGTMFKRTELFKKEKNMWLPAILKRIPKESLPKPYGGYNNFTAYPIDKC